MNRNTPMSAIRLLNDNTRWWIRTPQCLQLDCWMMMIGDAWYYARPSNDNATKTKKQYRTIKKQKRQFWRFLWWWWITPILCAFWRVLKVLVVIMIISNFVCLLKTKLRLTANSILNFLQLLAGNIQSNGHHMEMVGLLMMIHKTNPNFSK